MLSEITGSLPATNVRDNIIRDIDTIHSIQSITNSSYCRRWTFNVRWTVIYLGLSEYRTLHYWFQRRRPYFPSWRHVAMNLQRRRIGYRMILHVNIEHRTLHTEHVHWTHREWPAMISWRVYHLHRFLFFFLAYSDELNCTEECDLTILLVT